MSVNTGVFLDLVHRDSIGKAVLGIEAAVTTSFVQDHAQDNSVIIRGRTPNITKSETVRRTQLCMRIFKELRGDLDWGVDRILDHLPRFLRSELDGVSWQPEAKRALWTPPA